ncbi:MAG: tetratricopeptide repeat protein [Bacteroidetes bacterium]|nr:tetratricopeptide repeat protein [Bacteroidota bacterium]
MRTKLTFLFLLFISLTFAQQAKIDSLVKVIATAKDTTLVNALNDIAFRYGKLGDFENALKHSQQALENAEKIGNRKGMATAYRNYGVIYKNMADYPKSLEYHNKALQISTEDKDKKSIAASLNNIANIYYLQSDFAKALDIHFKSLKIKEEIDDKKGIGTSLNGIAGIYYLQGNLDKAMEFYLKSTKIKEEVGDAIGLGMTYNNIGGILKDKKKYQEADDYFQKALTIQKEVGDMSNYTQSLNSRAGNFLLQNKYNEARLCYQEALPIQEKSKDKFGVATTLNNLGNISLVEGDLSKAQNYLNESLILAKEVGAKDLLKESYLNLTNLFQKQRNFEQALYYQGLYIAIKDSIFTEESTKMMAEMNTKYETEKKELQITSLEKDKALSELEINKQKSFRYNLMAFSALIVVLAFVLLIGFYNKRKANKQLEAQKLEIEIQKAIVDEKNKDITDSINYAKRIQTAILPSKEYIQNYLPQSFILYQPKDIVSGDFYWFAEKNECLILAIADCTGHGVPGAFMSMIGNDILTQIVIEKGIIEPHTILTLLHEGVKKSLKQDNLTGNTKDGMDISVIMFPKNDFSKLYFSGALRPLWFVKSNTTEIIEYKGDKHSIGGAYSDQSRTFTLHEIALTKGDTIYLSSDGYADQFGGSDGKKMMTKNMKKLLSTLQSSSMKEQQLNLETHFHSWKANREQVDDVLVFGVRV